MSHSPVRRFVLVLVLLLAPGIGHAWALGPSRAGCGREDCRISFVSLIRNLVSFLWDGLTGNGAPGASGTTTDLGPEMDPNGRSATWGPV